MTRSLHTAVEELAALTVGEDPMRIEAIIAKLRAGTGDAAGRAASSRWRCRPSTSRCGTSRARRSTSRCGSCWAAIATASPTYASGSLRRGLTDKQAQQAARRPGQEGLRRDEDPDGAARQSDAGRRGAPREGDARRDRPRHQADVRHQPALAARAGDRHRPSRRGGGRRPVLAGGRRRPPTTTRAWRASPPRSRRRSRAASMSGASCRSGT